MKDTSFTYFLGLVLFTLSISIVLTIIFNNIYIVVGCGLVMVFGLELMFGNLLGQQGDVEIK